MQNVSELDISLDSRSALQALNCPVPKHKAIAEIKDYMKRSELDISMHWLRAHVGYTYNERAVEMAKTATTRQLVEVEVNFIHYQAKNDLIVRALSTWQDIWDTTENGLVTYDIFPRVRLRRLQRHVYVN